MHGPNYPRLLHQVPIARAKLVLELHDPGSSVPVTDPEVRVLLEVALRGYYAPRLFFSNAQSPATLPETPPGNPLKTFSCCQNKTPSTNSCLTGNGPRSEKTFVLQVNCAAYFLSYTAIFP